MADVKIRIIGEDEASKEIEKTDKSLKNLGDGLTGIAKVTAGAAIAMMAFSKVLDFGEAGAKALQTAKSFETLMQKVGAAPDLLDQLREASRGTIADLDLMNSTSLLLAGTQGDLATALANATPQLLEMAKAAAKLNPSLGDTTFLYDSLARGIKRGSPLILDNLGIMVSLEEANQKYAASLGVAVEALTQEQMKVALLNEVLEKGGVLMDQAGGNADSLADSFMQLKANVANAGDEMKGNFAPALISVVKWLNTLTSYTKDQREAFAAEAETALQSAKSHEEYWKAIQGLAKDYGFMIKYLEDGMHIFQLQGDTYQDITKELGYMSQATWEAINSMSKLSEQEKGLRMLGIAGATAGQEFKKLGSSAGELLRNVDKLAGVEDDVTKETWKWVEANRAAKTAAEELNEVIAAGVEAGFAGAMEGATQSIAEITDRMAVLESQMSGLSPGSERYAELIEEYRTLAGELDEATEAFKRTTAEMIFNQAAAGLTAEAAYSLGRALGVISEQDYAVAAAVESLRQLFDLNGNNLIEAGEGAQAFALGVEQIYKAVEMLQKEGSPITVETLAEAMKKLNGVNTSAAAADLGKTAVASEDLATALDSVPEEADAARKGVEEMGSAVQDVADKDLQAMIKAIDEVSTKISKLPKTFSMTIKLLGGSAVLSTLNQIYSRAMAINNLAISIPVNSAAPAGGSDGAAPPPATGPKQTPAFNPTLNITQNVSGAVAAEAVVFNIATKLAEYM